MKANDSGQCTVGCGSVPALLAVLLSWICHGGWFWFRVSTGEIMVDLGPTSPLTLYLHSGELWDGMVISCLIGVVVYLTIRHWRCPQRRLLQEKKGSL